MRIASLLAKHRSNPIRFEKLLISWRKSSIIWRCHREMVTRVSRVFAIEVSIGVFCSDNFRIEGTWRQRCLHVGLKISMPQGDCEHGLICLWALLFCKSSISCCDLMDIQTWWIWRHEHFADSVIVRISFSCWQICGTVSEVSNICIFF